MSNDNSNAELGIAITEAKAAQRRLERARGFEHTHNWTINTLEERTFGMFVMLIVVLVVSVWAFNIPPLIRYTVTIAAGAIFVFFKSMATKRKRDLANLRQAQVEEHSRKK